MRVSVILLYLIACVCGYALFVQATYLIDYFQEPQNSYRHEYLGGIFMTGLLSAPVWIGTLVFSLVHSRQNGSRPAVWLLPLVVSALVALLSAVAFALSLAA